MQADYPYAEGLKAHMSPAAYSRIYDRVLENLNTEFMGELFGAVGPGEIYIMDATTPKMAISTAVGSQMDDVAKLREVKSVEDRIGEQGYVGWWHSHPGHGLFMSDDDIESQKVAEEPVVGRKRACVAMVIDPKSYYAHRTDRLYEMFCLEDGVVKRVRNDLTTS